MPSLSRGACSAAVLQLLPNNEFLNHTVFDLAAVGQEPEALHGGQVDAAHLVGQVRDLVRPEGARVQAGHQVAHPRV